MGKQANSLWRNVGRDALVLVTTYTLLSLLDVPVPLDKEPYVIERTIPGVVLIIEGSLCLQQLCYSAHIHNLNPGTSGNQPAAA
jgi:hypothetical protein